MKKFLGKLLSSGAGEVIDKVKDVVDEFTMSPEERKNYQVEQERLEQQGAIIASQAQKEQRDQDFRTLEALLHHEEETIKLGNENTSNARAREIAINTLPTSTLFQKNFPYFLAAFVFVMLGGLSAYIIGHGVTKAGETTTMIVFTFWTGVGGLIIGYFFGTSKSSSEKNRLIEEASKK